MCVIFIDVGQDVHIEGGDFTETINAAVRAAYTEGYLRKSVVRDPLYDRVNTKDNTPAIIHTRIVPGDKIDILVTPLVTIFVGVSLSALWAPAIGQAASAVGQIIMWATEQQPFIMGVLVSVIVGIALTLPISSAAI